MCPFSWQALRFRRVVLRAFCESQCVRQVMTLKNHILHFTLYTPHRALFTRHFALQNPHFIPCTLRTFPTQHAIVFTLHTIHSTPFPTPQSTTLHSLPGSTLGALHFTLHTLHLALHTVHFTLQTLHCTLYSTLYTTVYASLLILYTLHSKL